MRKTAGCAFSYSQFCRVLTTVNIRPRRDNGASDRKFNTRDGQASSTFSKKKRKEKIE